MTDLKKQYFFYITEYELISFPLDSHHIYKFCVFKKLRFCNDTLAIKRKIECI